MEQSKAMEYESRMASSDVLKPRNIYIYIYERRLLAFLFLVLKILNHASQSKVTDCRKLCGASEEFSNSQRSGF
jgi:hypothetical protein